MKYTLKLDQFEGPFELLLKLIEDEKLDITTISLAAVTDQYLAYLERKEALAPDEVADFLVVAAKLIYIKSKYLLPALQVEEEDGEDLELQLKIYREYYEASKAINALIGKRKFSYVRTQPFVVRREAGFSPPTNLKMEGLPALFETIVKKIDTVLRLPNVLLKATMSIRDKIDALKDAIRHGIIHFHTWYDASNKQDVIVSFLALLELVKERHVTVDQSDLFSEIVIKASAHE